MTQFNDSRLLLKKAHEDLVLLNKIVKDNDVSDSIFGFHAQQSVEKLLKALLSFNNIEFPRSHDLRFLLELMDGCGLGVNLEIENLCDELTPYSVTFRYDDVSGSTVLNRTFVLSEITKFYNFVKSSLSKS